MTFTVLLLGMLNQKKLIKIIESLSNIDNHMKNIHIKINYESIRKFGLIEMLVIICLFSTKIILQYFSEDSATLFMYSTFNLIDYINTVMLCQYINLVLLVRQRFMLSNIRLKTISKFSYPILTNDMDIYVVPVLRQNDFTTNLTRYQNSLLLIDLAKIYDKLCAVSRLINYAYNIQILVTVGSRFVMITTQLLSIYNAIRIPEYENNIQYAILVTYLTLNLLKIFVVASASENTAAKVRNNILSFNIN